MDFPSTQYDNFSELGSGSGNNTTTYPLLFPCRSPPYSQNTTSPGVWSNQPQLEHLRWYVVATEIVFLTVGLAWNIAILGFYLRDLKLLKEPANIFLLNLTVADIFFSIFITLSTLTAEAAGEFVFGFSDYSRCIYCKFLGVVMCILVCISLYSMAALSINRCMLLTQPIHYKSLFTWKVAVVVLPIIWVTAVAVSVPPLFGFGDYEYNLVFGFCNARWTGHNGGGIPNVYFILLFGLQSIVPIAILLFTNIWVVKIAKTVLKTKLIRRRTFSDTTTDIRGDEREYQRQQIQLARVFGALLVAHALCWLPVITVMFVSVGVGANNIPLEIFVVSWLAFLTGPVVHPILEMCFVKDLRYKVDKTGRRVKTFLRNLQHTLSFQKMSSVSSQRTPTSTVLNCPNGHTSLPVLINESLKCSAKTPSMSTATNNGLTSEGKKIQE